MVSEINDRMMNGTFSKTSMPVSDLHKEINLFIGFVKVVMPAELS